MKIQKTRQHTPHRFPLLLALACQVGCTKTQESAESASENDPPTDSASPVGVGGEVSPDTPGTLQGQEVMAWVPPYSIPEAKEVWNSSFGDIPVPSSLTRLGLQFWTLTTDGGLDLLYTATNDDARWFLEKAHAQGVLVLATVMNNGSQLGQNGFHWSVVRQALADGGHETVAQNLVALVEELNLDGVDIDLESGGDGVLPYTGEDREMFAALIETLGPMLHEKGKLLTVDSFPTSNGTVPQPSWWSDWKEHVDTIHAMAYVHAFKGAVGSSSYQGIQDAAVAAGFSPHQVLMGLPMWRDAWAGDESNTGVPHSENLTYITHCLTAGSGVALWSLDNPVSQTLPDTSDSPWSTPTPWELLLKLKEGGERDQAYCEDALGESWLIDDFAFSSRNKLGGKWKAVSDYWSRPEDERASATEVLTADGTYNLEFGEGQWGDFSKAYLEGTEGRILSVQVEVQALHASTGWGGIWMDLLSRDCSQLVDPDDGCGWRSEALVDLDVSEFEAIVVGIRCDAEAEIQVRLQSRAQAIASSSTDRRVTCDESWQDQLIPLEGVSSLSRIQFNYRSETAPSKLGFELAGLNFDQPVIESP